jgi:hypothetical protein
MNSALKKFSDSKSLEQCDGLEIALAIAFLENVRYSAIRTHPRPASATGVPRVRLWDSGGDYY